MGVEATVLSHEINHLDGVLHTDKTLKILNISEEERKKLRGKNPYQIISKTSKFDNK